MDYLHQAEIFFGDEYRLIEGDFTLKFGSDEGYSLKFHSAFDVATGDTIQLNADQIAELTASADREVQDRYDDLCCSYLAMADEVEFEPDTEIE